MKKLQLIMIVVLLHFGACGDINFGRSQVCIEPGINSCNKWNTTVELTYYYYSANYMCFPASTRVQTASGPKLISQISVGDQILAYDFAKGRNVYSPVTAWLHRNTDSLVEFTNIKTRGANAYLASSGHNIAYNQNGTIGFKYADELQAGDELISVGEKYLVESADEVTKEKGLYSPMTATSNFYIYPYESVQAKDASQSLILVHCLAQIDNPHKQKDWIYTGLFISGWVGLNQHQNSEHENYLHPITHLMKLFSKPHRKIKYHLFEGDGNHLQSLNYHSGSSGSSRTSYDWDDTFPYYNTHQTQQNKKRQITAIFASLMQINSLITAV